MWRQGAVGGGLQLHLDAPCLVVHLLIPLSTRLPHILKLVSLSVKGRKKSSFYLFIVQYNSQSR